MQQFDEAVDTDPVDLIARFYPCQNYPRADALAIRLLAQDLAAAATKFNLSQTAIVDFCVLESGFCPTGHDLFRVAQEMREAEIRRVESKKNQYAEWEKQYGKPEKPPSVAVCLGNGREWKEIRATADRKRKTLLDAVRAQYPDKNPAALSWAKIYRVWESCGERLNGDQRRMMEAGE